MSKKLVIIITIALYAISATGFQRQLEIGVAALKGTGASITAIAEEESGGFEWAEYRPYYSLSGRFFIRDYEDEYGTYTLAQIIGSAGNIEFIEGALRFQASAGAHISRMEGGYEYVDFVVGARITSDCTFFLDRSWVIFDGALLTESKVMVGWGELRFYPHRQFGIGFRIDYDGDLDTYGEAPILDDPWNNGLNLEITATWILNV